MCYICSINTVYADCLNEDVGRVTELAKNITVNYAFIGGRDYDDILQIYSLSFDFGELDGEVYVKETHHKISDFFKSNEGLSVEAGKYSFDVYYKGCENTKLRHIDLELPLFNKYSLREECNGLQDKVDICREWYQGSITEDYFDEYMKKNDSSGFVFDINFIYKYKWFVISGFGVLAIIGVIFMIRGFRKNRLD